MTFRTIALALLVGASAAVPATAASAQAAAEAPARQYQFSKEAVPALKALQNAVAAKDSASLPGALAAAEAAVKNADDRHMLAQLRLQAASVAKDDLAIAAAIDALFAEGAAEPRQVVPLGLMLAQIRYNKKQFDQSAAAFERVLAAEPNNTTALTQMAEARFAQKRHADAVKLLERAITVSEGAGQKPKEAWYKRAVGFALDANLPSTLDLSRRWVAAYPSVESWRDSLRVYRRLAKPDGPSTLDTLRLQRAVGALEGEVDFEHYAYEASEGRSPTEARTVLEEGIAAKQIDPAKTTYKEALALVKQQSAAEDRDLAERVASAKSSNAAAASFAVGNAYYGRGEFGPAAEFYRAALGNSGGDKDLINLRLGMALARAGDQGGAEAALKAVNGSRAELAKFWLLYAATAR